MNRIIKTLIECIGESEVRIALFALLVTSIVLFLITLLFDPSITFPWAPNLGLYNEPDFWVNILVESHGMLLDLFLIGVFLFWLQRRSADNREKKLRIKRYEEEIDDYRGWDEKEAMYRIVGNIKRLNKEGVSKIDLRGCFLERADLRGAKLQGAQLQGAWLLGTILKGACLKEAQLQGARVARINWIEKLKEWNVEGVEDIEARYYVNKVPETAGRIKTFPYQFEVLSTHYLIKEKPKEKNNNTPKQCMAKTKNGEQCKRKPQKGYDRCYQHLKQEKH